MALKWNDENRCTQHKFKSQSRNHIVILKSLTQRTTTHRSATSSIPLKNIKLYYLAYILRFFSAEDNKIHISDANIAM